MTKDEKIAKLGKVITDRATVLLGKDKLTPDSPEYLGTCINVYGEVVSEIEKNKAEQNKKFDSIFDKYSIARIKRE